MKWIRQHVLNILLSILVILFMFLLVVMEFPLLAEWWTIHVARTYHVMLAWFVGWIPFSLMELVIISWVIVLAFVILKSLRFAIQKQWKRSLLSLQKALILFLTMANLYVGTAGVAYARIPVEIPQYADRVEASDYTTIIEYYRDAFNAVSEQLSFEDGSVINPYTMDVLNEKIHQAFEEADLSQGYFTPYSTRIKPLLSSFLYREFHITGVHFAPTTEATINTLIPDALIPFTMAHELAHAKGVMREEDANLVALYVCLTSDDPYLQYSAYFNAFYALLNLSRYIGDDGAYQRLYQTLNLNIRADYQYQGTYWSAYDLLDDLARWVNDTYLKIFGNEGVSSYVDVPVIITIQDGENTIDVIETFSPYQQLFFYQYFI